jgi:RNA polymerase sigma-70 factor (ECF subfamily)
MLFSPDSAAVPSPSLDRPHGPHRTEDSPAFRLEPSLWNERHRDYLLNVALGKTRHPSAAEDLVQDTFLAAWKARHHFEGKSSERTWLTRILLNKIADSYRSAGRKPSVAISQITAPDQSGEDLFDALHHSRPGHDGFHEAEPSAAAERAEFLRLLEHCLENVPAQAAAAYRMRELQGLSTEEIAEALRITPNHLWVLIHRAKKALRAQLEDRWEAALEGPVPATAIF